MAMNLRNPIQLLRGTGKAIESARSNEGTMFYDTEKGIFRVKRTDGGFYDSVRAWDTVDHGPTIYADSVNGDDTNSGFTIDTPVKTLDKAIYLCSIISSIQGCNIALLDGSYSTSASGLPSLNIYGYSGNKSAVTIDCGNIFACGRLYIRNVTLNVTGSDASLGALVSEIYGLHIIDCIVNLKGTLYSAIAAYNSGYTIASNCDFYLNGNDYTCIIAGSFTSSVNINTKCRFYGGANYSVAFVFAANNVYIEVDNDTEFSGTYTGRRYYARYNSVINSFGGGENFFPGNTAGTVLTGSAYY